MSAHWLNSGRCAVFLEGAGRQPCWWSTLRSDTRLNNSQEFTWVGLWRRWRPRQRRLRMHILLSLLRPLWQCLKFTASIVDWRLGMAWSVWSLWRMAWRGVAWCGVAWCGVACGCRGLRGRVRDRQCQLCCGRVRPACPINCASRVNERERQDPTGGP